MTRCSRHNRALRILPSKEAPIRTSVCLECDEIDQIAAWFDEFQNTCESGREAALASQLARALEGFMDIESEMLSEYLLSQRHRNNWFARSDETLLSGVLVQ